MERILDLFDARWRGGESPRIADFLELFLREPDARPEQQVPLLAELVKIELEYRWRPPDEREPAETVVTPPRLDAYLDAFPQLADDQHVLLDLVAEEYRVRKRWGDQPAVEVYLQRFPAVADRLEERLSGVRDSLEVESLIARAFTSQAPDTDASERTTISASRYLPEPAEAPQEMISRLLAETHPFRELPVPLREELAASAHLRAAPAGEWLIRQGETADCLLVVLEGEAEVIVVDEVGEQHVIDQVGRHDVVGEISLLTQQARGAHVRALSPVRLAVIPKNDFQRIAGNHPILGIVFADLMAARIGRQEIDALYGKQIGTYRIKRRLGRGSMGIVYEATDENGRPVALKMMRHNLAHDLQAVQRFRREAAVIRSLNHPNIIRVFDEFSEFHTFFIVMELCTGVSLSQAIRSEQAINDDQVRGILGQLASALAYAHDRNVIHRDVKPANVMILSSGSVKLADFGLAKSLQNPELTASGQILGTPRYMAPEQLTGQPLDTSADVFALGCIGYELLTGAPLFRSRDILALLREQLSWKFPKRGDIRADLPEDLYAFLRHSLAKEPRDRRLDLSAVAGWAAPA